MSARNTPVSQPHAPARTAGRATAGCWKLAAGQALSLRTREPGVLEVARGRAWVTVSPLRGAAPAGVPDQVLQAGERLRIPGGQHLVMEAWSGPAPHMGGPHAGPHASAAADGHADAPAAAADAAAFAQAGDLAFRWDAEWRPVPSAASEWECSVRVPLRDLWAALGQCGRALGQSVGQTGQATGRLLVGLARFGMRRLGGPRLQRAG
ncbi:DUF2917 domain-containing protein [Paracidovorax sp. MALMAid1276]|uniref:DUF2917 domain-containing protein n=1 Tax=Paracidovorax sp. MALMAid1276 TaxID=3411631 RepID=UPI003B9B56B5